MKINNETDIKLIFIHLTSKINFFSKSYNISVFKRLQQL